MDNFSELPDFPRLEQLARALWRQPGGGPGAALMVGAGFSRNCDRITPNSPYPPLWPDLRNRLAEKLTPGIGSGTTDPLRMAEEFRAYFGQSALDDFIRNNVPDAQWLPGRAHRSLVELPWSDILTTNWDTLLERAARTCRQHNYGAVLRGTDLAHNRSPRIIKLHGTIGDGSRFVFAEDDYRTYATDHAALVNAARQVFIENEVCLVGFSGDDPNFLQWTGWVRDQLGGATRRIYLVGVLSLSRASRQLLEQRNIAAIDLAPLVADAPPAEQHSKAATLFLDFLTNARTPPSHHWEPMSIVPLNVDSRMAVDPDTGHHPERLRTLVGALRSERQSYPGWVTPPLAQALQLGRQVDSIADAIGMADRPDWPDQSTLLQAKLELAWRIGTGLGPLTIATERMLEAAWMDAQHSGPAADATRLIAPVLLRNAREAGQGPAFRLWASRLKAIEDPDMIAHSAYEEALLARDREDWPALERLQGKVCGPDPLWQLRRARLLFELRRSDEATALLEQTLEGIRDQMASARTSVWLRSRRAWCQWLLYYASVKDAESPHKSYIKDLREESQFHCNPADDIRDFNRLVEDAASRLKEGGLEVIPGFRASSFQTLQKAENGWLVWQAPGARFERFRNAVGLPLRAGNLSVVGKAGIDAYLTRENGPLALAGLWPYMDGADVYRTAVETVFGRVVVAQIGTRRARLLKQRAWATMEYWLSRVSARDHQWARPLEPVFGTMAILGRLTPRLSQDDVLACWNLCVSLSSDERLPAHLSTEHITDLARLAADAMDNELKTKIALDAVRLPYPGEDDSPPHQRKDKTDFYSLLRSAPHPEMRGANAVSWEQRISAAIDGVATRHRRGGAATLLVHLMLDDALTSDEKERFSSELWRERAPSGLPDRFEIAPSVLVNLPAPGDVDLTDLLEKVLFPSTALPLQDPLYIQKVRFAAFQRTPMILERDTARRVLRQVNDAVARYSDGGVFMRSSGEDVRVVMGLVLGRIVLPSLKRPRKDDVDEAIRAVEQLGMTAAMEGLPALVHRADAPRRADAIHLIQTNLLSNEWRCVSSAARAISWWASGERRVLASRGESYPHQLTSTILAAINANHDEGGNFLLWLLGKLLDAGILRWNNRRRLMHALPDIVRANEYSTITPLSRRAIAVSPLRVQCAVLTRKLNGESPSSPLFELYDALSKDPLPEVRSALIGD
jgi:hypothetical protein